MDFDGNPGWSLEEFHVNWGGGWLKDTVLDRAVYPDDVIDDTENRYQFIDW